MGSERVISKQKNKVRKYNFKISYINMKNKKLRGEKLKSPVWVRPNRQKVFGVFEDESLISEPQSLHYFQGYMYTLLCRRKKSRECSADDG